MSQTPSQQGAGAVTDPSEAIVGRIEAAECDLDQAVEAWLGHLRSRRHKPNGFRAYKQKIDRMIRETGARSCDQLTAEWLLGWLDSHAGRWTGKTYNANLSALRSFTQHLARSGKLVCDPLELTDRAFEEQADGSRAATTEEARSILRTAWARQGADGRCKGDRSVYWACLFLAGCRLDEPGRWQWRHLLLEESLPVIRWTPDINKNRRLQECAIAPELHTLLLEHRARMVSLAEETPVVDRLFKGEVVERRKISPADPRAYVFARVPSPGTFRTDRERSVAESVDSRGRRLTSTPRGSGSRPPSSSPGRPTRSSTPSCGTSSPCRAGTSTRRRRPRPRWSPCCRPSGPAGLWTTRGKRRNRCRLKGAT